MNDSRGLYKALGLQPGSSVDEVKRAYSKLIRLYHPDHGSEMKKAKLISDERQRTEKTKEIEEICRKVNEAKAFLCDEKNKKMYDSGIDPESGVGQGSSFFDIMSHFAGRNEKKKVRDTVQKVKITFRESFLGKKVKYKVRRKVVCRTCSGKGGEDVKTCDRCQGRGKVQFKTSQLFFVSIQERVCESCNGSKFIIKGSPCKSCKGKKMLSEENIIELDIPKGVMDQETVVFENQGDEHPDYEGGHLIFLIAVAEDPGWMRIKDDLISRVRVDLFHALAGGEIFFEHINGRVLKIHIGRISNFEDAIVLKGEGFESKRGHGNLYLKPDYVIPKEIDREKLMAVLPPSKPEHQSGEEQFGYYGELPHGESTNEAQQGAEGFFSEFFF